MEWLANNNNDLLKVYLVEKCAIICIIDFEKTNYYIVGFFNI